MLETNLQEVDGADELIGFQLSAEVHSRLLQFLWSHEVDKASN